MSDTLLLNVDWRPISVLPLSTLTWQETMKLVVLDKVNVLEWHEDWEIHTVNETFKVPSVVTAKKYINIHDVGVTFTRHNVYLRDNFKCQYCGDKFYAKDLTLDHVLPRAHGGPTTWGNIVTACKPCNHGKGSNKSIVPKTKPRKPSMFSMGDVTVQPRHDIWNKYLKDFIKQTA